MTSRFLLTQTRLYLIAEGALVVINFGDLGDFDPSAEAVTLDVSVQPAA